MSIKFVVTGCTRSGTRYISKLFKKIGCPCGHENVFNMHRVGKPDRSSDHFKDFPHLHGESSHLAVPFLNELPAGTILLHQIRDPVSVIRSHMGIRFFAEPYQPSKHLSRSHPERVRLMERCCPGILSDDDELKRCMRYWALWNRKAQEAENISGLKYFRYRIEDMDASLLRNLVKSVGLDCEDDTLSAALSDVPRTVNTRPRDDSVRWETLPEGKSKEMVRTLAIEYGYDYR